MSLCCVSPACCLTLSSGNAHVVCSVTAERLPACYPHPSPPPPHTHITAGSALCMCKQFVNSKQANLHMMCATSIQTKPPTLTTTPPTTTAATTSLPPAWLLLLQTAAVNTAATCDCWHCRRQAARGVQLPEDCCEKLPTAAAVRLLKEAVRQVYGCTVLPPQPAACCCHRAAAAGCTGLNARSAPTLPRRARALCWLTLRSVRSSPATRWAMRALSCSSARSCCSCTVLQLSIGCTQPATLLHQTMNE